jgi:hypothetical protein
LDEVRKVEQNFQILFKNYNKDFGKIKIQVAEKL